MISSTKRFTIFIIFFFIKNIYPKYTVFYLIIIPVMTGRQAFSRHLLYIQRNKVTPKPLQVCWKRLTQVSINSAHKENNQLWTCSVTSSLALNAMQNYYTDWNALTNPGWTFCSSEIKRATWNLLGLWTSLPSSHHSLLKKTHSSHTWDSKHVLHLTLHLSSVKIAASGHQHLIQQQ